MSLGSTTLRGLIVAAVAAASAAVSALAVPVAAAAPLVRGRPLDGVEPNGTSELVLAAIVAAFVIVGVACLVWLVDRRAPAAEVKHLPAAEERERTRRAA